MVKEMPLPRDSLERRRGGRGGPAPRRDQIVDKKLAKKTGSNNTPVSKYGGITKSRMNDYNNSYRGTNKNGKDEKREGGGKIMNPGRQQQQGQSIKKKSGFNVGGRVHMGTDAYKGHAKKIKADLIHKAKVKKEFARTLKKEAEETPEFYKKIFGEKTIDDEGNIVQYKNGNDNEEEGSEDEEMQDASEGSEEELEGSEQEQEQESEDEDEEKEAPWKNRERATQLAKGTTKNSKTTTTTTTTTTGKQDDGTYKRAAKPNPFKAAIEKREREKKAIQDAKDRANQERALARKGRDAYYAKRQKTTEKIRQTNTKGQPALGNQIKLLLGKIKQDVTTNQSRAAPGQKWKGSGGRSGGGREGGRGTANKN